MSTSSERFIFSRDTGMWRVITGFFDLRRDGGQAFRSRSGGHQRFDCSGASPQLISDSAYHIRITVQDYSTIFLEQQRREVKDIERYARLSLGSHDYVAACRVRISGRANAVGSLLCRWCIFSDFPVIPYQMS